jgi:hypothetical protein
MGSTLAETFRNDFDAVFAVAEIDAASQNPASAHLNDDLHHAVETTAWVTDLRTNLAQLGSPPAHSPLVGRGGR